MVFILPDVTVSVMSEQFIQLANHTFNCQLSITVKYKYIIGFLY